MEAGSLPVWAQGASVLAIALVSAVVGVFKYLKTEVKETGEGTKSVSVASFIDSKLLKEVAESIKDHQEETSREVKKITRSFQDLRDSIAENTEAIIVQTDSTGNLLKFLTRNVIKPDRLPD